VETGALNRLWGDQYIEETAGKSLPLRVKWSLSLMGSRHCETARERSTGGFGPDALPVSGHVGALYRAVLWILLFLICLGLGYPTLNRYDPRIAGNPDSSTYYNIVLEGRPVDEGNMGFRVLVPYVAKPFYHLAKGRVGTWEPVFLGLLISNSIFVATTAWLLFSIGYVFTGDRAVSLLAATLYLLNFSTVNENLAGMVDSAEAFCLMGVTWTLLSNRWWFLLLWGCLGALARETFVPFSVVFGMSWWLIGVRETRFRFSDVRWIGGMGLMGLSVLLVLWRVLSPGHPMGLRSFLAVVDSGSNYLQNLFIGMTNRNFWYPFLWLLPLGLLGVRRLPRRWVVASLATAVTALVLGAIHTSQPISRPVFNILGPMLSLSVALLLASPAESAVSA
jgi:hypothetical protein